MTTQPQRATAQFNLAEPDAEFRERILARVDPEHRGIIWAVQVETGESLDILGRIYNLTREAGPIIEGEAG